ARRRYDEAIDTFRDLIRRSPDLPEPCAALGAALSAQGNLEGAREAFRQAADRAQPDSQVAAMMAKNLQTLDKIPPGSPESERNEWRAFWSEVDNLRKRTGAKSP